MNTQHNENFSEELFSLFLRKDETKLLRFKEALIDRLAKNYLYFFGCPYLLELNGEDWVKLFLSNPDFYKRFGDFESLTPKDWENLLKGNETFIEYLSESLSGIYFLYVIDFYDKYMFLNAIEAADTEAIARFASGNFFAVYEANPKALSLLDAKDWALVLMKNGNNEKIKIIAENYPDGAFACRYIEKLANDSQELHAQFLRIKRISFFDVIRSDEYVKNATLAHDYFVIGKGEDETPLFSRLEDSKHIIIGGEALSGKSTFIHTILASLFRQYSGRGCKYYVYSAKENEYSIYGNSIMYIKGGEDDECAFFSILKQMEDEMNDRFEKYFQSGAKRNLDFRNVFSHNEKPTYILVIDEMKPLVERFGDSFITCLESLLNHGDLVNIHLIISSADFPRSFIKSEVDWGNSLRICLRATNAREGLFLLERNSDVVFDEPWQMRLVPRRNTFDGMIIDGYLASLSRKDLSAIISRSKRSRE